MIAPRRFMPPVGTLGRPLAPTPVAFSDQSLQTLGGVNPTLADVLKETERRALEHGIEIEVSEGLRDQGRQAQLVSEGKSQTMNSRHLTGNAVDIHIRNPDGSPNWDFNSYVPVANIAKQVATEMGVPDLVWGGDWKTLKDGVHFQIGGPASGGTITRSTKGGNAMPMGLFDMQEEPQTFGQRLKGSFKSGDLMDRLALAFNSMRMNPDQGIAQLVSERQKGRAAEKTANRTAQWLMTQGHEDLAQALMTGALDAKTAVATALKPAADDRTAMIQNYEYWLTNGKTPQEAEVLARAGAGGTNVTTALPEQEKAYDKGMGEWAVKTYTGLQDAAAAAGDQMANLGRMESLMNDPNFRSGTGTDAIVSMQKMVEALGGNPADVGSIEAFRAASTQAVLASLGGSLGAGFSNGDRDFIMGMSANLDNSVQGNKMILTAQMKIAQRKIELARLADEYIAKNGRLDANWPMVMRQYAEQNPLFGGTGGAGTTDPNSYIPGG